MIKEKYEKITGKELPIKSKMEPYISSIKLTLDQFYKIHKGFTGCGWGRVINLPCDYYCTKNENELIEVYGTRNLGHKTDIFLLTK